MAKFKPYKILESQLDSLPIQEGQFILTTDTKKLYSDTAANTRILLSQDAITDLSISGTTITYTRLDGTTGTINITKSNLGLGNVENKSSATIRGELTSTNVTTALGYTPINSNLKGANGGLAELDDAGKVPTSQLPSYVDDVLEYDAKTSFPATGETGKIYIDKATNKTYRWGGSAYAEISPSLALGTTSSTAFRGDYGQTAYTHAVTNKGSQFNSGLYKITTNAEGHVTAATAVAKSDITALGIPAQDTTYSAATTSATGLMSSEDKTKLNGIAAGAQVNTITGVKGNSETNYRTGNVNITKANIGLGNVDNTADANKEVKYAETAGDSATVGGLTVATAVPANAKFTDTTYTFSNGLSASGTTVSNSGVRSVGTGGTNGTISINTNGTVADVAVKGLSNAAYKNIDTTISITSTSTNLPTSVAVVELISTTVGNIGTLLDTINGETSYSIINMISFTIDGTSYQAEEGMTWYEWCNSDYNTSIWVCPTSTQTYITYSGGTGEEYLALESGYKTTACVASDVIIANYTYGIGTSSK